MIHPKRRQLSNLCKGCCGISRRQRQVQFLQTNEAPKHIPVCDVGIRQPDRLPAEHNSTLSFKQAAPLVTRRLVAQALLGILMSHVGITVRRTVIGHTHSSLKVLTATLRSVSQVEKEAQLMAAQPKVQGRARAGSTQPQAALSCLTARARLKVLHTSGSPAPHLDRSAGEMRHRRRLRSRGAFAG